MNFFKYLKGQWTLVLRRLLLIALTILVMWPASNIGVDSGTIAYLALIEGVFLILHLSDGYLNKRRRQGKLVDIQKTSPLQNYLSGGRTEERKLVEEYINQLIHECREAVQLAISNQQDQKGYIDPWVHGVKVPLSAFRSLVHSIEFGIGDRKYVLLENELSKIDEYVEQVLCYARFDSFSRNYLIQEYGLKGITQPMIRSQANYFIQKNIRYGIIGEDRTVLTDTRQVASIFNQLLSNAIKYTPGHESIIMNIEKGAQGVSLSIKGSRIGIPAEDLKQVFDKRLTGRNGRFGKTRSAELGLCLTKSLAERLGIHLTAESAKGKGTTMTLFFPILDSYSERR